MRSHLQGTQTRRLAVAIATLAVAAILLVCFAAIFHARQRHASKIATRYHSDQPVIGARTIARPVYPYSVLPGGAYNPRELRSKLSSDEAAARHYQRFHLAQLRSIGANFTSPVYVSYRKGNQIYWTRKPVRLTQGETLLTDGTLFARARCGNRISTTPEEPVASTDPPGDILDVPQFYKFEPIPLPATPESKVTEPPGIPGPSQPDSQPIFPGVLIFPLPVAGHSPGTPAAPGHGNGGSSSPSTPATPGHGNGGSSNPSTPTTPGHGNGGSTNPGTPTTPGPGNGGSTNPGIPAILGSDYNTVGGIDAPPITISGGVDETDGHTKILPPAPISPVPEPGSVVLLLTGVVAIGGAHLRYRRSCRSKSDWTGAREYPDWIAA